MKNIDWPYLFMVLLIVLSIAWGIFYAYCDIRMKWNLAHIKNCPCLMEMANDK